MRKDKRSKRFSGGHLTFGGKTLYIWGQGVIASPHFLCLSMNFHKEYIIFDSLQHAIIPLLGKMYSPSKNIQTIYHLS